MFAKAHTPARLASALIAALAIAALVVQFQVVRSENPSFSALDAAWSMARYLTILTTILIAVTFARHAARGSASVPWMTALMLADLVVALGYHLLLRGINEVAGPEIWSDLAFHTVIPILVAAYWLIFVPKGQLSVADVPGFLIWPAVYLSYALTRGGLDGQFPYPFLDPSAIGWAAVLWTVAKFGIGIVVAGVALVVIDRLLDR